MIETVLLELSKETENKLRWDTYVDGVPFYLYVPKRRIPRAVPQRVRVTIAECSETVDPNSAPSDAEYLSEPNLRPIVTRVWKYAERTQTIRYRPEGDSEQWELGEPYIPTAMTHECAERLEIKVSWEWGAR